MVVIGETIVDCEPGRDQRSRLSGRGGQARAGWHLDNGGQVTGVGGGVEVSNKCRKCESTLHGEFTVSVDSSFSFFYVGGFWTVDIASYEWPHGPWHWDLTASGGIGPGTGAGAQVVIAGSWSGSGSWVLS